MATPARARAGTRLRLPVAWLGSRMTGQMGQFVQRGDGGDVASVAGDGFEGADAALAEDDVRVAVRDHVLGRHEKLLDGGAHAALQQHGAAAFAERLEQREVLHVARADLQNVGVLGDQVDVAVAHDFGDDAESGGFAGLVEQLEAFDFEALEIVGRSARFEGSSAKEFRAGAGHDFCRFQNLALAFDRAGTGHDHEFAAANGGAADRDFGLVGRNSRLTNL